jgi:hypothetical protein
MRASRSAQAVSTKAEPRSASPSSIQISPRAPGETQAEHLVERGELARRKQEPDRRGGAARAARGGERDCRAEKFPVVAALGVGGEAELLDQA